MAQGKTVKLSPREKAKLRIRRTISGSMERPRISVFKSSKHIYAQAISDVEAKTIASASTREKEVLKTIEEVASKAAKEEKGNALSSTKSRNAAKAVGLVLAKRMLESSITNVVFDRNGYRYSGRIQALADGAREGGLKF